MSGRVRRETEIRVRVEGEATEERVAAAESNRVGMAFTYRCMAMLCSFVMVGVVAGWGFFFVRAWVHAFQKRDFSQLEGFAFIFFGAGIVGLIMLRYILEIWYLEEEMQVPDHLPGALPYSFKLEYYVLLPRDAGSAQPLQEKCSKCTICLNGYKAGDRLCRLPCDHVFHGACIDTWLHRQHVCPLCRIHLLPWP